MSTPVNGIKDLNFRLDYSLGDFGFLKGVKAFANIMTLMLTLVAKTMVAKLI